MGHSNHQKLISAEELSAKSLQALFIHDETPSKNRKEKERLINEYRRERTMDAKEPIISINTLIFQGHRHVPRKCKAHLQVS